MDAGILLGIIGILIALVALVAGVPPFAQMIWGKPALTIGFTDFTGVPAKSFFVTIDNRPVTNRFAKFMGVTRETADVHASFDVREDGTNRFVAKNVSGKILTTQRDEGYLVKIVPRFSGNLMVVFFTTEGPAIVQPRTGQNQPIAVGDYLVDVMVLCGEQTYRKTKHLKIEKDWVGSYWY